MLLLLGFVNRYEMVSSSNHEGRQTVGTVNATGYML